MNKVCDLTSKRFNKLVVISRVNNDKYGNSKWLCKCDCGNKVEVLGVRLRNNHTKSCGCLQKESYKLIKHKPKHNMIKTRLYRIWNGIKSRTNENSKHKNTTYKNYSGRNIKICKEWRNNFLTFYDWAMENGYNDNLTIDRIDVNGNYEPLNCRWITIKEQQNNRRNNTLIEYNDLKMTISQWESKLCFPKKLITNRLKRGWSIEKTLTTPKMR